MDKKEKLEMLRELSEKELTKKVLIPLFESQGMGFKNVRYTHRMLEFGKDVIYCKDDEFGRCAYTAVQVKKIRITTREIDGILRQVQEAFGEPFTDAIDGKKKDIDRVVVLTSNEFLEEAKDSFWASLRKSNLDKVTSLIDGNQLVVLVDKHLPSVFWDEYECFKRYFKAMREDFERVKDIGAIGQKEPMPLEEIYVSLKVSEERRERGLPAEGEWKIFEEKVGPREREEIERRAKSERIIDAERAVRDYDRLVIVGAPGAGKTTLLKYLALRSCRENLERQERVCVPIPITLRELAESGKGLREYIDQVFEKYDFPKAKEFVEKDLKEGKCRVLLDGFDELATKESQEKVAGEIERFAGKYRKSQIVVTSRVTGYHDELKGFTRLELMEFDDGQIGKFIENWFGKREPERARLMLGAIRENERIKAIARNPLMIAIIAIIYEEDRKLPQRRADLYERCVEVLLSKWDVQKRLRNKYTADKKEFILRKIAFYGHSNNKRILAEEEVTAEMQKHLSRLGLKSDDVKPLLDEIWQRSYLLRQISMSRYDFLHLSFQEYFTALELREGDDGLATIIQHIAEPWWEEPILLYAGINKDASGLIKAIKDRVPEDIFCSNLMLFGRCVADAEFTEPTLRDGIVDELWGVYTGGGFQPLREGAMEVLALIKPDRTVESLMRDLESAKDSSVRWRAAKALGSIGSDKAVGPLLNALVSDKDSSVRWSAADALGSIGSDKAVKPLLKALVSDREADVRRRAAVALGSIGSDKAVESLLKALVSDKEAYVRWGAAGALGMIGSAKPVEPLSKALVSDKGASVRERAAYALGMIGGAKAVETLLKALVSDKDADVRGKAAGALGEIRSEKAVDPLLKVLVSAKEASVRGSAAYAIGMIGSDKVLEPLLKALVSDKDAYVRGRAALAIGGIGSEKAVEPLLKALVSDKDASVRVRSAYALGGIGSDKALEPLLKALISDKDVDVRGRAAEALGRIGSDKAVEGLKAALKDEGESALGGRVKDAAFEALERISKRLGKRMVIDN